MGAPPIVSLAGIVVSISLAACSPAPAPTDTSASAASPQPIARPMRGPDLTSGLGIPAQERFVFAGGQSKPFTAFVTNRGAVPVQIIAELDGAATPIATVAPGKQVSHRFQAREGVIFENPSDQDARLLVEVWGQTEVGMRYQPMMSGATGR